MYWKETIDSYLDSSSTKLSIRDSCNVTYARGAYLVTLQIFASSCLPPQHTQLLATVSGYVKVPPICFRYSAIESVGRIRGVVSNWEA